jgi:hypothetical protein
MWNRDVVGRVCVTTQTVPNANSSVDQLQVHNTYTDTAACSHTGAGINGGRIVLPIVPIKVHVLGRTIDTYALLDSGSTNTFCSDQLITDCGVEGTHRQLTLTTLEKENSVTETKCISLVVSDANEENFIIIPTVYSRPRLSFNAECASNHGGMEMWPHLQGLELPDMDHRKVMLLIGQDVPDALVPLDVRRGPKGSPYATKTLLGWSLNGPLGI